MLSHSTADTMKTEQCVMQLFFAQATPGETLRIVDGNYDMPQQVEGEITALNTPIAAPVSTFFTFALK